MAVFKRKLPLAVAVTCLFLFQLVGTVEAYQNNQGLFFHCVHSGKKIARISKCPCGCNQHKKMVKTFLIHAPAEMGCNESSQQMTFSPAFLSWSFLSESYVIPDTSFQSYPLSNLFVYRKSRFDEVFDKPS